MTGPQHRGRLTQGDSGSGSVWVLAAAAVLAAAGLAVTLLLGVVAAHRRASAAADLAALGGAGRLAVAPWQVCPTAAAVAEANDARLEACMVTPGTVTVIVAVTRVPPLVPPVRATARAGVPVIPFALDG